ncbi:hypothetical protein C8Q80DRAFT_1154949 [Daedaleopsis nitida]|nr:hypothetical protein C8Q80DRAFT_1154949 [Daedaleopsis nitida]
MLGTRTKQVFAYGRRGQRVVNVYNDYDNKSVKDSDISQTRPENEISRRLPTKHVQDSSISLKSVVSHEDSPIRTKKTKKSPKTAKVGKAEVAKPIRRLPLGSIALNAPSSPAVPPPLRAKRRQTTVKAAPLTPRSPIVSVDIVVVDAQGRRVSQEHRICISRADVQANMFASASSSAPKPALRKRTRKKTEEKKADSAVIVISSDSEEDVPLARPRRAVKRKAKPLVISDDDEESESGSDYNPTKDISDADTSLEDAALAATPRVRRGMQRARPNAILSPSPTPSLSPPSSPTTPSPATSAPTREQPTKPPNHPASSAVPLSRNVTLPPQLARPQTLAPFSSLPDFGEAGPSRLKPRVLTPIRARPGRALFPAPPSPPSPTTPSEINFDDSFDFAQLALSPRALAEVERLETAIATSVPAYVRPLLNECAQSTPHEFSAFIEMFPHDPIVRIPNSLALPTFQKIGEASFSEVFGIGDVVLKIVPLRDEECRAVSTDVDGPAPSDAKDVLNEIIVTRAMGATCPGFVELLRAYVVRGKYPSLLLDLWDEYDERKGSESVRPDTFTVSQLYAIIVLPNGGPDLEAYTFSTPTKTGWQQACSIFWQVTRTLAEAEELVSFEHRDLHWGQILVKNIPSKSTARRKTRLSMDDPDHGVLVTIIDLGLARMDSDDGAGASVHWTPFDEETFEGEGDYQFDVYRMMRTHNGDAWEDFRPLTNVMWLHYLVLKLLQSKRLRPPAVARKSAVTRAASGFSERECYECLKEVEAVLAQSMARAKTAKRGRKNAQTAAKAGKVKDAAGLKSADELLALAMRRGWVL